jgi:hypothetical protein
MLAKMPMMQFLIAIVYSIAELASATKSVNGGT